ncbi:MAG: DUF805 domain-containing protein [Muribaculaceae bacterium]|nr:DUF805 domain-containing protein [Muribaculaceae bacterium]MDE6564326.1 DUF805 domain-containing protein [Muribaculaceae bacterium]
MNQYQVPFVDAVKRAVTVNYCNFNGRSSRSEYWWYALAVAILNVVISTVLSGSPSVMQAVSGVITLGLLLPGLGLAVRRLHDINKSGWYLLLALIPIVGAIILIVWFCKESEPQTNQYGPVPNVA